MSLSQNVLWERDVENQDCFVVGGRLNPFWPGGLGETKMPSRIQDPLSENANPTGRQACRFQKDIGRKKGFRYKERDLFFAFSPFKRKKKDKRKTGPELSHPDKNFLVFTTCKINFFPPKEKHFCYLADVTTLGGNMVFWFQYVDQKEQKSHTTFFLR